VKVPEDYCPKCGGDLGPCLVLGPDATAAPSPGDLTACLHCTAFLTYTAELRVRELTDGEYAALTDNERRQLYEALMHESARRFTRH
jgi:hypothetical protein